MVKIVDLRKVEERKGVASTVKADEFVPRYTEAVERFVRDNFSLGEQWRKDVLGKLYNFQGKNKEGDLLGSSPYMLALVSTYMPEIPLITGKQLLSVYQNSGEKNPFGSVYIDFGLNLNGNPEVNKVQAMSLLEDFKKRNISLDNGRVPDLVQVKLRADVNSGLVFRLKDDVSDGNVSYLSDYSFNPICIGKNGLFRSYLSRGGVWVAVGGDLAGSSNGGRVVRYDAGSVGRKKIEQDDISKATSEFMKRF